MRAAAPKEHPIGNRESRAPAATKAGVASPARLGGFLPTWTGPKQTIADMGGTLARDNISDGDNVVLIVRHLGCERAQHP